ncbi:hypothetical protein KO505_06290 [Psychrosphaera sp. F3M07]|uniref:STAS/SEC14 domain-containing protein n=1 Tax=Psychrosphaera aquimarina TaxID=2044854 RepID=A0ABU3R4D5_9GAMM|nr:MULTISPECIES: hypothetical protein [Psychrosphaera]MBU2917571.1 hypothetical protein [Psychrosphaera sp. F3M07]MDU0114158.1 hypothetical protein [Psychrosphaera aquimarina]
MDSKIELIEGTDIIKVSYRGDVTLDERVNCVEQICVEYKALESCIKILIDAQEVTEVMSEVEQTLFANYIASREELEGARVAVLVKPEQLINNTVIEQATILGHKTKLFNDIYIALNWLNETE